MSVNPVFENRTPPALLKLLTLGDTEIDSKDRQPEKILATMSSGTLTPP
jgi:hypothetical protein